jgi:hypothetical protein
MHLYKILVLIIFVSSCAANTANKDAHSTTANGDEKPFKEITADIRPFLKKRITHITKIHFEHKGHNYKFMGVHSKRAIENFHGSARIVVVTLPDASGVYEAKVYAKGPDGIEVAKSGNGGKSTFFPDSWDETRILDEAEYAIKHNKGFENGVDAKDGYYGFSRDGKVRIAFYYNESGGGINSFFPVIGKTPTP